MNPTKPNSENMPATGWHVLGEIELTAGSNPVENIRAWLKEILMPLQLHDNLLNKVLTSAQEYALRALRSNEKSEHGHIHLAILVQQERASQGSTWGFFRIEKIDNAEHGPSHPDHTVEFYLYLDGQ